MDNENLTYDDYCAYYATHEASREEEELHAAFIAFLEFVGAEETRDSYWSFGVQCRGLAAALPSGVHDCWCIPDAPCKVDSARDSYCYGLASDLDEYWNGIVPKLETQYHKIELLGEARGVFFSNDCNGYWDCTEYRNTLDALDSAYWDAVNAYVELFEACLETVCSITQDAMRDAWDYAYSLEAYEDFYCAYCV